MDRNLAIERKDLLHIVARLLSLALIAERAAGRSWLVRCLVFWLLRRAESKVRAFAVESGYLALPFLPLEDPAHSPDNGPGAAVHLACQLRTLAAAFHALAHQILLIARRWTTWPSGPRLLPCGQLRNAAWLHRLAAALEPSYADTS